MNRFVLFGAAGVAALAGAARAQTALYTVTGNAAGDQLGKSVAGVGDVDADGRDDFAFGIPYTDVGGPNSGSVQVRSGRTGAVLFTFNGLLPGDRLGESVARAGDVNRDGHADIIAGAPLNAASKGYARVYSGANGQVLYTFFGDLPGDWFGASVDGVGDFNADGWDDVIVGAPFGKSLVPGNIGEARVFSGRDGSVLHTFNSTSGVTALGTTVSGAGDVDQDGNADVIIGAPQYSSSSNSDTGRAYVFSGRTGAQLFAWTGATSGENFATCVDGGQDVNNDGWPDLVVGDPFADYNGGNSGSVYVFSGHTGTQLYRFNGNNGDEMGRTCALAGDVDGDGWADVIGGARFGNSANAADAGVVRVWSGRTSGVLFALTGTLVGEFFGSAVASAGDADMDNLDEIIVGWPADVNGTDSGRIKVWSGTPFPVTTYCTATTNALGCAASITTTGTPSASNTAAFTIRATQVVNQKSGMLFYGRHGDAIPYLGGYLCVAPPLSRTFIQDSAGNATGNSCSGMLTLNMNNWIQGQNDPTLGAGDTVFAQFWYRDLPGQGIAYSNAVSFTILP